MEIISFAWIKEQSKTILIEQLYYKFSNFNNLQDYIYITRQSTQSILDQRPHHTEMTHFRELPNNFNPDFLKVPTELIFEYFMGRPLECRQDAPTEQQIGIFDLPTNAKLTQELRNKAAIRFYDIILHYLHSEPEPEKYDRPLLIRLVYENSVNRDRVLMVFFRAMNLPMDGPSIDFSHHDVDDDDDDFILRKLLAFADLLFKYFFALSKFGIVCHCKD